MPEPKLIECKDCRHCKIKFEQWIFGDGARFAMCTNIRTFEVTQDIHGEWDRYHLGEPAYAKAPKYHYCFAVRKPINTAFSESGQARQCGPEARYFEPRS